jgi:Protein of unknown function (DUF3433)
MSISFQSTFSSTSSLLKKPLSADAPERKVANFEEPGLPDQVAASKWRPWTLHPAALVSTIVFTLAIMTLLAYLQIYSDKNHGIIFASSTDDFSIWSTFLYLYFPTVIAVLFSTWWSWIELDVKRLEPWYQLTNATSKKTRSSLLLQYPVEFLAWIPFRAAKRRCVVDNCTRPTC